MHKPADRPQQWLIVSDLDGTLLDHHDYSHSAVDALLARLEAGGVPVVLNSSKTFEEMRALRRALNNRHPFIAENGSAIFIPRGYFPGAPESAATRGDYWVIERGITRERIQQFLAHDAQSHPAPYLSFSAASVEQIVQMTGLDPERAAIAKQRHYSEALHWSGDEAEKQSFIARARSAGLRALQGGRFLHLLGHTDKGSATLALLAEYRKQTGHSYKLLASGDSPNDLDMLKVADIAVIVRSPAHPPGELERNLQGNSKKNAQVLISEQTGPEGWSQVVSELFL